jgi:hypothetical protein
LSAGSEVADGRLSPDGKLLAVSLSQIVGAAAARSRILYAGND